MYIDKVKQLNSKIIHWTKIASIFLVEFIQFIGLIIYYYLEAIVKLLLPKSRKDITDQLVIITGAGQGLGREIAIRFAEQKAKIAILDINEKNLNETKEFLIENYGVDVKSYVCNVSKEIDINECFDKIREQFDQPIDILVNNAGIVNCLPIDEVESSAIVKLYEVNVFAQFWAIRKCLPEMKQRNSGHIVTIGSIAGYIGAANIVDYCSTKFASRGLMEALGEELRSSGYRGIKLTLANPVAMKTTMFKNPVTKFERFMPIITPTRVADEIIDGVLKEKLVLGIPNYSLIFGCGHYFLPSKVKGLVHDFLDYNVKPHK